MVEAGFGKASAVKRRGVEIADARIPCGVQRLLRLLFRNGAVEIADGGGAEAEFGECQAAVAEPVKVSGFHAAITKEARAKRKGNGAALSNMSRCKIS